VPPLLRNGHLQRALCRGGLLGVLALGLGQICDVNARLLGFGRQLPESALRVLVRLRGAIDGTTGRGELARLRLGERPGIAEPCLQLVESNLRAVIRGAGAVDCLRRGVELLDETALVLQVAELLLQPLGTGGKAVDRLSGFLGIAAEQIARTQYQLDDLILQGHCSVRKNGEARANPGGR